MTLILFVHQDSSKNGVILKDKIHSRFNDTEIQLIDTFNRFKSRLKKPSRYDSEVYILFIESRPRLTELKTLIDLLDGKRLILVLPDDSQPTLSLAHQFFPRYFTIMNETYDDLCAVLSKMTDKMKNVTN